VRVKPFITQTEGELLPQWDDEVDDEDVTSLVDDIRNDCVDQGFWDVTEEPPANKNRKRDVPETDVEVSKKKKGIETKTIGVEEDNNMPNNEETQTSQLYSLMKTLTGKLDNLDASIEAKVCTMLAHMLAPMLAPMLSPMNEKLAAVEKELQKMKEKDCGDDIKVDANCYANEKADVSSKEMSWVVELNSTSQDGLPTQRVVKKLKKTSKKSGNVVDDMKEVAKEVAGKKLKNKIDVPHLLDNSSGEDTWSDPMQRDKAKQLDDRLDAFATFARKLKKYTSPTPSSPQHKRQIKLASSQLYPFVGNSTMKRIIPSVTPSVSAYDPFAAVDDDKMRKLLHFLLDEENALDKSCITSTEFYRVIITPRNHWSSHDYGWLTNMHMWSAMTMFYRISLININPMLFYNNDVKKPLQPQQTKDYKSKRDENTVTLSKLKT
ncbi:unnamed protein product, partial [Eruca vesicaria subsp. sativa]|nr:unnamed protein product [Eruca vesicaria subsp. sativa]